MFRKGRLNSMSEKSQNTPSMRVRIIQALLPSNIKTLDPSEKGALELVLARSLGFKQISYIDKELSNLYADGIIKRTKDTTIKGQNRCRLKHDRGTIKKLYCDKDEYESLRQQIRADFAVTFLKDLIEGMSKEFSETIQELAKKSDFLFNIILEYSTKQDLSSFFASYLDTYTMLGIEDPELSSYWLWYILQSQSIIQDERVNDLEERQIMFKEMGTLIKKAINDRTDLQKKKEIVDTIEKMIRIWKNGIPEDRENLVTNCSLFQHDYELIHKKNDVDQGRKLELDKIYNAIQSQITQITPWRPPPESSIH